MRQIELSDEEIKEFQEIRAAGGFINWERAKRAQLIAPRVIKVVQLCYTSGVKSPDEILDTVLKVLDLPKRHRRADLETIQVLIRETLLDCHVRLESIGICLPDPFKDVKQC